MAKDFINPSGLYDPTGYTHIITATGGKVAFISGQIASDASGQLVGANDFRAQVTQVLKNLDIAVQAAGGTLSDIVKITVFVVDYDPAIHRPILGEVRGQFFGSHKPASTLVGIQSLALAGLMLEIEAVAVID